MLEYVKLTLRIKTTAYDSLLSDLIRAGAQDLGLAGVVNDELDIEHIDEVEDSLIRRAMLLAIPTGEINQWLKAQY